MKLWGNFSMKAIGLPAVAARIAAVNMTVVIVGLTVGIAAPAKPDVVSRAGAQGIAQFMPETAATVGLDNPFDPLQAIAASARLLRNLVRQFGNLGLAAAAYNAGPR